MVRLALKPSLREASCCSVEVMKGGAGLRLTGLASTEVTEYPPTRTASSALSAAPLSPSVNFFSVVPSSACRRAWKSVPSGARRSAATDQYSCGLNISISFSRSQTMRRATDCTRPAEREPGSLRQRTGERLKRPDSPAPGGRGRRPPAPHQSGADAPWPS